MAKRFAEALRVLGLDAEHLLEVYGGKDPGDSVWIPHICKSGAIIITADKQQARTRGKTLVECRLYQKHRGIAFFFSANYAQLPIIEQMAVFFRAMPEIQKAAAGAKRGQLFDVSLRGTVTEKHLRKANDGS